MHSTGVAIVLASGRACKKRQDQTLQRRLKGVTFIVEENAMHTSLVVRICYTIRTYLQLASSSTHHTTRYATPYLLRYGYSVAHDNAHAPFFELQDAVHVTHVAGKKINGGCLSFDDISNTNRNSTLKTVFERLYSR